MILEVVMVWRVLEVLGWNIYERESFQATIKTIEWATDRRRRSKNFGKGKEEAVILILCNIITYMHQQARKGAQQSGPKK